MILVHGGPFDDSCARRKTTLSLGPYLPLSTERPFTRTGAAPDFEEEPRHLSFRRPRRRRGLRGCQITECRLSGD